jgi:hypothetical protein
MGQAALFSPPPIHSSNIVIFPQYLAKNRLKNFVKAIGATYTTDKEGLVTILGDLLEFHFKTFHKHIELVEISVGPALMLDAQRCIEFIRYESYLLQKPIYCETQDQETLTFLKEQGFRIIVDEEERQDILSAFWEKSLLKA